MKNSACRNAFVRLGFCLTIFHLLPLPAAQVAVFNDTPNGSQVASGKVAEDRRSIATGISTL